VVGGGAGFDNDLVPIFGPALVSHGVARLERRALAASPDDQRGITSYCRGQLGCEIQLRVDVERRLGLRCRAYVVRRVRGVMPEDAAELEREAAAA
jgi:hypothetical protein